MNTLDIESIIKTCNWNPSIWEVKLNDGRVIDVYFRYYDLEFRFIDDEHKHRDDLDLICIFEDAEANGEEQYMTTNQMLPYLIKVIDSLPEMIG